MELIPFGSTGIRVSAAGLGCGGHSRLGSGQGFDNGNARQVISAALDLGVTYFDTSPSYENEAVVGKALKAHRTDVVLSTKFSTLNKPGAPIDATALRESLEGSLRRLGTDYVDVLSIQSVTAETYSHCCQEFLPELHRLRDAGKIRAFGLTEWFFDDTTHVMAERAVQDGAWDYLLVGFNLLNQGAREKVLGPAAAGGMATAVMFAVRRVLSDPELLRSFVAALVARGDISRDAVDMDNPLGFVFEDSDCTSLTEAAYRFCRHESHGAVILTGTGSASHLRENVASIGRPPLPASVIEGLRRIFGHLDFVTGQETVTESGQLDKKLVAGKPQGH